MVLSVYVHLSAMWLACSAVVAERVSDYFDDVTEGVLDESSMLQRPPLVKDNSSSAMNVKPTVPYLVPLRRESVPIYRQGKIASFKTSYSGVLTLGMPAQEFRVVFDTGSGHLVLPATECDSEACLVEGRRRFNMSASKTSVAINSDGSLVPPDDWSDQVTIGYGTGEITGEFTKDIVCFGKEVLTKSEEPSAVALVEKGKPATELCVEMSVVLAIEMSTIPFKTFHFDGILGLGLKSLALSNEFSFFEMMLGTGKAAPLFGIFLTEGEHNEECEVAFGGYDERRLLGPMSWVPVVMPEHGHWQIAIQSIRIGGQTLDFCEDGTCRGIVDTGTSHLGVPAPYDKEVSNLLAVDAGDLLDCRLAQAPEVEIELKGGMVLRLDAWNYMRRLPLREGISVSSGRGVEVDESKAHLLAAGGFDRSGALAPAPLPTPSTPQNGSDEATLPPQPQPLDVGAAAPAPAPAAVREDVDAQRRFCHPRLMPVKLPAPLGPKLFILGEPLLHRYYTAYDWKQTRVGFSLANNRRNTMSPEEFAALNTGMLPQEVDMLLVQREVSVAKSVPVTARRSVDGQEFQDETVFLQVTARVQFRVRERVRTV